MSEHTKYTVTAADVRKVRALIEQPGTFLHGALYALRGGPGPDYEHINARGYSDLPISGDVQFNYNAFCVGGAAEAIGGLSWATEEFARAFCRAAYHPRKDYNALVWWSSMVNYNNRHSQEEVLAVLDSMEVNADA